MQRTARYSEGGNKLYQTDGCVSGSRLERDCHFNQEYFGQIDVIKILL